MIEVIWGARAESKVLVRALYKLSYGFRISGLYPNVTMFYFQESSVFERFPTTSAVLRGIVGNLADGAGAGRDFSLVHITLYR